MSDLNIICHAENATLPTSRELAQLLRSRWPEAHIEELTGGIYSLLFVTKPDEVWGRLSVDGEGIAFEVSGLTQCAEFTVWLRGVLPLEMDLEFFDDELEASVVVGPSTTVADIVAAFG